MLFPKIDTNERKELDEALKAASEAKWYRRLKVIDLSSQGERVPALATLFDLAALLFANSTADSAWQSPVGMDASSAHHLKQFVPVAPHFQHLAGHVHAHFGHHSQDVSFRWWCVGANNEIGATQSIKVRGVVRGVEDAIEQLTQFLGGRRRIDVEQVV